MRIEFMVPMAAIASFILGIIFKTCIDLVGRRFGRVQIRIKNDEVKFRFVFERDLEDIPKCKTILFFTELVDDFEMPENYEEE